MGRHPRTRTLSEYVDGELAPRPRARVAAHLARCAACREIVHEWRTTAEILKGTPGPGLPSDLFERIRRRRAAGARALLPAAAPAGRRRPALLLAVAVAVALVVIGAEMLTTTSNLQAGTSELRVLPAEHRKGWIVVEYRAASALEGHDHLALWAGYRTRSGKGTDPDPERIVLTELAKAEGRVFRGSLRLPDSVMYALFAVERPGGSRVHPGTRPRWALLVYGPGGGSLLTDPEQAGGPARRGPSLARAAAPPSTTPSGEKAHRWSQLQIRAGVDVRR